MRKRFSTLLILATGALFLQGCAVTNDLTTGLTPKEMLIQPYSLSGTISARTRAEAMNAAISAAKSVEWTPKTIEQKTGYLYALRTNLPLADVDSNRVYKLEVYLPADGKGEVNIRVEPPKNIITGLSTETMASDYLTALKAALPNN